MVLVQKNVAHPWMCDVLGHMTTRHYVAMFDDAAYHMLYTVFGWIGASDAENKIAWADVQHVIDYKAEVSVGDVLEIDSKLTKIGNKSITIHYEMKNLGKSNYFLETVHKIFFMGANFLDIFIERMSEI